MIKDKKVVESQVCQKLTESASFVVLATAKRMERSGKEVLHLEIGEPDFSPPPAVKEAVYKSLEKGETHYTTPQGIRELREEIARYETEFRGVEIDPDRVIITPGAKPIILFTLLSSIDPGEEILYPDPGYLSYKSLITFVGGVPVPYHLNKNEGFSLDFDHLSKQINKNTAAIIINSPSNPTGSMLKEEELKRLLEIARERELLVISDEVYSRIIYDNKSHVSIFKFVTEDDKVVLIDSFSKTYAMTGFRLGYGILPNELVRPIVKLIQNSFSCVPQFIQRGGIAAIVNGQEYVKAMVQEFERRRDRIYELLKEIDEIQVHKPEGAFYFFPEIRIDIPSAAAFAQYLLENFGVALLPGEAFGKQGQKHVRISFANSLEILEEAVRRFKEALVTYKKDTIFMP